MDVNHAIVVKNFEEKVSRLMRLIKERQPTKKIPNVFRRLVSKTCVMKDSFKEDHARQKEFLEYLSLLIVNMWRMFKLYVSLCVCAQKLISLVEGNFHKKYYLGWWGN